MANVFGILTAIVLALASFVAYKNKDAYANELSHRKDEDRRLAATKLRLKTAQDNLKATHKTRTDTEEVVAKLKADESARKKANDVLKQDIDAKTAVADANKTKLDQIREQTKAIGEIRELAQKVKTLRTEMDALKVSIADNLTKLANLTQDNAQTVGRNDVLKSHTDMISRRESFFTKAQINSIFPKWGFVTLGTGHVSGVVTGSTLEIVREGKTIAKLLVTAVETNTASATIIPDSLAEGTVLMVGDQVVPSHKPAAKTKVPAKPAGPAKDDAAAKDEAPVKDEAPAKDTAPTADPSMEPAPGPATEPDATPAATPEATPESN